MNCSHRVRLGGVRNGVARRRGWTVLWSGVFGLHRPTLPPRPLARLAAFNVHPTSTGVLRLGFAFGPSRRPTIPPVLRPPLTSPRRTVASRPRSSRTTPRTKRTGHLGHPRRSPRVRPATFIAHPPRLRNGPLMTTGFAVTGQLARTIPPHTRSPPPPWRRAMCYEVGERRAADMPPSDPHGAGHHRCVSSRPLPHRACGSPAQGVPPGSR